MLRATAEVTSWLRSAILAGSLTLLLMSLLGAIYVLTEPDSQLPALLEGTSLAQKVYFLSREGLFIWRLTIDPDHKQLFLLEWVLRNFVIALGMLVLGIGLWAEGDSMRASFRSYVGGGAAAAFFLPYIYRIATGAQPWFHIVIDPFNPHYGSASALLALMGGFCGLVFFALRRAAIRRRLSGTPGRY